MHFSAPQKYKCLLVISAVLLQSFPALAHHSPAHNRLIAKAKLRQFAATCRANGGQVIGSFNGRVVCIMSNGRRVTCQMNATPNLQCWRDTIDPPPPRSSRPPRVGDSGGVVVDSPSLPPRTSPPLRADPSPITGINQTIGNGCAGGIC